MAGPAPDDRLRQAALDLAARGMHVIPLEPRTNKPAYRIVNWRREALPADLRWVRECWSLEPFNIGVATGGPSSIVVLDLHAPVQRESPHGRQVLLDIARALGTSAPAETMTVNGPDGSQQLYFRTSTELPTTTGYLGPRINTHGQGSYVVGPGSIVPGGKFRLTDASGPAPLPTWIRNWLSHAAGGRYLSSSAALAPAQSPRGRAAQTRRPPTDGRGTGPSISPTT